MTSRIRDKLARHLRPRPSALPTSAQSAPAESNGDTFEEPALQHGVQSPSMVEDATSNTPEAPGDPPPRGSNGGHLSATRQPASRWRDSFARRAARERSSARPAHAESSRHAAATNTGGSRGRSFADDLFGDEDSCADGAESLPPRLADVAHALATDSRIGAPATSPRRRAREVVSRVSDAHFVQWREEREISWTMIPANHGTWSGTNESADREAVFGRHNPPTGRGVTGVGQDVAAYWEPFAPGPDGRAGTPIPPGEHARVTGGTYAVATTRVPANATYGATPLSACQRVQEIEAQELFGSIGRSFDPRDAVFVDIETTGLSARGGAIVFLVGLGFFEDETFVVQQVSAPTPLDEGVMLAWVLGRLARFGSLVTYNGTTFDLPFLRTRAAHYGLSTHALQIAHIDLLRVARAVVRDVPNHRLATIEAHVLGRAREGDVPGSEAPARYESAVRTGCIDRLLPIFEHHRLDIVSLPALVAELARRHSGRTARAEEVVDVSTQSVAATQRAAIGGDANHVGDASSRERLQGPLDAGLDARDRGDRRESEALLLIAAAEDRPPEERRRAMSQLAINARDREAWDAAAAWWGRVVALAPTDIVAHVALSEIFEVRLRDITRAHWHAREAARIAPWSASVRRQLLRVTRELARCPDDL